MSWVKLFEQLLALAYGKVVAVPVLVDQLRKGRELYRRRGMVLFIVEQIMNVVFYGFHNSDGNADIGVGDI